MSFLRRVWRLLAASTPVALPTLLALALVVPSGAAIATAATNDATPTPTPTAVATATDSPTEPAAAPTTADAVAEEVTQAAQPAQAAAEAEVAAEASADAEDAVAAEQAASEATSCVARPISGGEIADVYLKAADGSDTVVAWESMEFGFLLALRDGHCAGDSIQFTVPSELGDEGAPVAIAAEDGTIIANATYTGGVVTVTLTEAVENPNYFGFTGSAWWRVSIGDKINQGEVMNLTWLIDGITRTTPITVGTCENCSTPGTGPSKWGTASLADRSRIDVTIVTPTATYDGQTFIVKDDLTSSNQAFACDAATAADQASVYKEGSQWGAPIYTHRVPLNEVSCSSTSVTVQLTLNKGEKARFTLRVTTDPMDPGPWTDAATITSPDGGSWSSSATIRLAESGGSGSYQQRTPITPAAPALEGTATCTSCGDDSQQAYIVVPSTEGVVYFLNDTEVSAGKYPLAAGEATVKAVAADPSRFVLEGDTIWRFTVDECDCPCPTPTPTETPTALPAPTPTPTEAPTTPPAPTPTPTSALTTPPVPTPTSTPTEASPTEAPTPSVEPTAAAAVTSGSTATSATYIAASRSRPSLARTGVGIGAAAVAAGLIVSGFLLRRRRNA